MLGRPVGEAVELAPVFVAPWVVEEQVADGGVAELFERGERALVDELEFGDWRIWFECWHGSSKRAVSRMPPRRSPDIEGGDVVAQVLQSVDDSDEPQALSWDLRGGLFGRRRGATPQAWVIPRWRHFMEEFRVPGFSFAIAKGGRSFASQAYGFADLKKREGWT